MKTMRSILMVSAFLCAYVLPASFAPRSFQNPGSLQGVAVELGTGRPLARVKVALLKTDPGNATASVITDGTGRFRFQNIPPGQYRVSAMRDGYVRTEYGQRTLEQRGMPV